MKLIKDLTRAYLGFLTDGVRNAWLEGDGLQLYLRKGLRLTNDGRRFNSIEAANVCGGTPEQLVELIELLRTQNPRDGVYFENVEAYGGVWGDLVRNLPWVTKVQDTRGEACGLTSYYGITNTQHREPTA